MDKIFITGATGFLGSHIAEHLVNNNLEVIALKRTGSDTSRCKEFEEKINWIELDSAEAWKSKVKDIRPDIIIHCAWIGVEADDRNSWTKQLKNIAFQMSLLEIAESVNLKKFLILGSQAEYGYINEKVNEDRLTNANTAYGSVKLACLEIFKSFCEQKSINWVWLRVFSVFGEREDHKWLIPSLVKKIYTSEEMDLTAGEQKYAYMYVKDFSTVIFTIISKDINPGIYNISSNKLHRLKTLVESIRERINPNFKLNFGALPYRDKQPMHIEGDISKLTDQIGPINFTDFNVALSNTIKYYSSK